MIEIKTVEEAVAKDGGMEPTKLDNVFINKRTRRVAICQETLDGQELCIVVHAVKQSEMPTFGLKAVK